MTLITFGPVQVRAAAQVLFDTKHFVKDYGGTAAPPGWDGAPPELPSIFAAATPVGVNNRSSSERRERSLQRGLPVVKPVLLRSSSSRVSA